MTPRLPTPMRPVSLSAQAVTLVVVEVVIHRTWTSHDAAFHWSTHFLVAVTATALWHAAHLRRRGGAVQAPLLASTAVDVGRRCIRPRLRPRAPHRTGGAVQASPRPRAANYPGVWAQREG